MEVSTCSVGELTTSECHKLTFNRGIGIEIVSCLSDEDIKLLHLRTEVKPEELKTICLHHQSVYLKKFESLQKNCCDPLIYHKRPVTKNLRPVTLQQCNILLEKGIKLKPGEKLCCRCRQIIYSRNADQQRDVADSCIQSEDDETLTLEEKFSLERAEVVEKLNTSLTEAGCSPLKLHGLHSHSKIAYGKRKMIHLQENVRDKINKVLQVEIPSSEKEVEMVIKEKACDMDKLVEVMKTSIQSASRKKQIQMLTIPASLSWPQRKIQETFGVSNYSVRRAQKLFKEIGVLAEPQPRHGRKLPTETVSKVLNFYQSDEQSRIMPGMKDVISIGKEHQRKRLILGNLKELYAGFKKEYPNVKVGFSKFCALRPKWCVLAGSNGTHSVCVCTIHQNVILLLHASQIEGTYKDIMKFLLCDDPMRECMLRHCNECPEKNNLVSHFQSQFADFDGSEPIEFSQWISTDRTHLVKTTSSLHEFIDDLTDRIEKLIPHSFIAKSQSFFLKDLKENLPSHTAVILLDFNENYSFIIQDEVQGYHWTSESCTLHPVVVYCINTDGEKITSSHCIVSDDLKHDVSMVYKTQEIVLKYIKDNFPHITEIHYYTDGCAAQYKNKFNFINLCHHQEDFQMKAQWSYFATSHGKSACDGIGGTTKRLARKESIQKPLDQQITTARTFFDFCNKSIEKVKFNFVGRDDIDLTRSSLQTRFKEVQTLPGTRSFHNFKPLNHAGTIEARRLSSDKEPSLTFNLRMLPQLLVNAGDMYSGCFVACKYDNLWYFGMITEINQDEGDAHVKFLHPNGPSPSFYWPRHDDS